MRGYRKIEDELRLRKKVVVPFDFPVRLKRLNGVMPIPSTKRRVLSPSQARSIARGAFGEF